MPTLRLKAQFDTVQPDAVFDLPQSRVIARQPAAFQPGCNLVISLVTDQIERQGETSIRWRSPFVYFGGSGCIFYLDFAFGPHQPAHFHDKE